MQGTAKGIRLSIVLLFSLLFVFCSTDDPSSDDAEKEWTWVPYDSDLLRISGRANFEKGDFVVLSWSASSITVAFVGTALEVKIRTNNVLFLDVFVDGEEDPSFAISIAASKKTSMVPAVSGLPYGTHVVTLYKRVSSNFGDWYFYGLRVLGQVDKELLPKAPERKIEFIGNSITCGSDVLIPEQGQETAPDYESSYYSFSGQTAKALGAETHTICSVAHGLTVNFDGSKSMLLPFVYEWTGTDTLSAVAWDHAKWHPDVVVMNLGTNDFASGVVDSAEFVNVAVDFVQRIRSYHPEAKIVLLDGPMLLGDYMVKCREFLDVVKARLEGMGESGLYRFSFEPRKKSQNRLDYHPVKEMAAEDAEKLSAWMRSEFDWD